MKGDTEVILMVSFFIGGMALVKFTEDISTSPLLEQALGATATLMAAFFGAKYAYKLQMATAEEKTLKDHVSAGNHAIFELIRTYNYFIAIKNQFIDPHRQNPVRELYILPMVGNTHTLEFRFEELGFIFDSSDPNLLNRLSMFQQEVASIVDVIAQRSKMHVEDVQPTIEKLEKTLGTPSLAQVEAELGKRKAQSLRMLTDYMVEGVDHLVASASGLIVETKKVLRAKFPGHKIIEMLEPTKKGPGGSGP